MNKNEECGLHPSAVHTREKFTGFFSHNSSMHSSRLRFISSARDFLHEEKIKAKSHVSKLHFTYTDLDEQGVTQGSPLTHALFAVYRVFLKCVQKF
jgi:hypothetical protein